MYRCESWTIKKAEHWRIKPFELCCWRRLLRVPWTARRSNQPLLKELNPEYTLEGLMLKQKLPYFGHLMRRAYLLKKILMLGKTEGRRSEQERMRWLDAITDSTGVWASSGSWWWTGKPGVLQSMGLQRVRHDWATERLNWTELCLAWCNNNNININIFNSAFFFICWSDIYLIYDDGKWTDSWCLTKMALFLQQNLKSWNTQLCECVCICVRGKKSLQVFFYSI